MDGLVALSARGSDKWSAYPPDVLPAWVAEMDYAPAPAVAAAVQAAVARGHLGYAPFPDHPIITGLDEAFRGFAQRYWGWGPPESVVVPGVVAGLRLVLETLCPPGPVVVPLPCYPPFRTVVELAGREAAYVALDPDAQTASLDLGAIEEAFANGARTFLLCSPHNPWGRVFTRRELEGLRDLAHQHGVMVVADEIHAPLALEGAEFVPYLTVDPAAVSVISHSKSFNTPGLTCAQVVTQDVERMRAIPLEATHGFTTLGVLAGTAAWRDSDLWLLTLRQRLGVLREDLADLLATHLPHARMRPLEGTYLAWLDLRAYGEEDPAGMAVQHGVMLAPGQDYHPGLAGHVRLNLATSAIRLEQIVQRLAKALV